MTEFPDTRESLLVQVRDPRNGEAWEQFAEIYRPIVYRLARQRGMQDAERSEFDAAGVDGRRVGNLAMGKDGRINSISPLAQASCVECDSQCALAASASPCGRWIVGARPTLGWRFLGRHRVLVWRLKEHVNIKSSRSLAGNILQIHRRASSNPLAYVGEKSYISGRNRRAGIAVSKKYHSPSTPDAALRRRTLGGHRPVTENHST